MRSSVDFAAAIRRGQRAGRRTLVVHYQPARGSADTAAEAGPAGIDADSRPARVGLVVSKAVGGSVVRSRVKRRLRHLMVDRMDWLEPGSFLVIRANPAGSVDDDRLGKDLDSALRAVTKAVTA